MSSTCILVTLLHPWIRRFTIIISAWWLRTSSKLTWEEVKASAGKLEKWSTPKQVRIRPKHRASSHSRDRRIKMHQSINHQSIVVVIRTTRQQHFFEKSSVGPCALTQRCAWPTYTFLSITINFG